MKNTAEVGESVLIIRGEFRGQTGIIKEIREHGQLYDYRVGDFRDRNGVSVDAWVYAEDVKDFSPSNIGTFDHFDVINYLTRIEIKSIARQVLIDQLGLYFDQVIRNRVGDNMGYEYTVDGIMKEAAKEFVNITLEDCKDELLARVRGLINDNPEDNSSVAAFEASILSALLAAAVDYIDKHLEEIQEMMKDSIMEAVKNISAEKILSAIKSSINMDLYNKLME